MNYQTMADIHKGLAQSGSWGCFDEFNRINIEVLSVVATQVKSILDAALLYSVPANREPQYQSAPPGSPPVVLGTFELNGDVINIIPTCGMFITMNPGYAGRTELPENLKALFRSCAMIRPDLALICENMLMSEGFNNARPLSIKFVTLYELSGALLSPQAHYDWGLRSVKSVLRVAGSLKRGEPEVYEDGILMRALRDFNTPKMPLSDLPIFLRLIQDLFPKYYNLPTVLNKKIQQNSITAAKEARPPLQADPVFIAKVVQLQELMDVRHSVMLLGPGGSGKTTIWKTLQAGHNLGLTPKTKWSTIAEVVDPKAVTSDELYGYMTMAKEWKDGCLSIIMRGMSKNSKELGFGPHQTYKWAVLDGDIDAVWIESMNTVMDDNKMLTLVSNERIPLSKAMRMVFEINSLANATPATVSRAGILFINETDIGWRPFVETWMSTIAEDAYRSHLPGLFDKYVEPILDGARRMKNSVPIMAFAQVSTLVRMMESYLEQIPKETRRPLIEILEHYFFIASVWAFGGCLVVEVSEDGSARGNHRRNFHELIMGIAGASVKLPKEFEEATCYDFFFDKESEELMHWNTKVVKYVPVTIGTRAGEQPFTSLVVPTVDSTRLTIIMDQLVRKGFPVMFIGTAGTGKTTTIKTYLQTLPDNILFTIITLSYYMDSAALQARIDSSIDKRSGRTFGPPNGKKMIFYMDDMNLPYIETYGTQNSLSFMRQMLDNKQYYDRADLGFRKEVADLQYLSSMNPTAGSFTVTERLQRNFSAFSCLMPSDVDLTTIYKSILAGHFASFVPEVAKTVDQLCEASIKLHKILVMEFFPDAERFMYNWNMRELTSIFQGVCLAKPEYINQPMKMFRLWAHETYRVFGDRLVNTADFDKFDGKMRGVTKVVMKDLSQEELYATPLIFTNWCAQPTAEPSYLSLPAGEKGMEMLSKTMVDKLEEYNSSNSIMDLVLFEMAMEHITRITRIIGNSGGNALLIGVGGSGKQSLSKLASFICGYQVKQLAVTAKFGVADLKEALKVMYQLASKDQGVVFLLTDSQIVNDKFLVYINDILATGWISDLFERDEIDAIFNNIRNDAKADGILVDVYDEMLKYLIARLRNKMHIVLCFSPVGAVFRVRARRFPGLINCTVIDKFHPWPRDALMSVANKFVEDVELYNDKVKQAVSEHMAEVHMSVTEVSNEFREKLRRYNYVTPKSFLELISFYRHLLGVKRDGVGKNIKRLDDGLAKLKQTSADVAELKIDVQKAMNKAEEEVKATDILVAQMQKQTAEANVEKDKADVIAQAAAVSAAAAAVIKQQASGELAEAQPAMLAAEKAVDNLDKNSLNELKGFKAPPKGVEKVTACCAMMLNGEYKNAEKWDYAKKMMGDVGGFLLQLKEYAKVGAKNMSDELINKLTPYIQSDGFNEQDMKSKSGAAANLCAFVVNVFKFNRIYVKVKPLMDSLEKAENEENAANKAKNEALDKVARLTANLEALQRTFEEANAKKAAAQAFAAACTDRLSLANRLVGGLASENDRWGIEVQRLRQTETQLIGDVLLGSSFVSYVGAFNNAFRRKLWEELWIKDMTARGVPISEGADPLNMLTDEAKNAGMMSEGLPADRISIENGSIITSSKRWPLIIDPQTQGIKWMLKREENNGLTILQLSQSGWLKQLTGAIVNGRCVIIQNIGEELDATLEPVLSRAVFQKGRTLYIKVGGEDFEYDPKFKLYLQTKLDNPHYRPEIQAQCTIVNFIATETGLMDQLLARVVNEEKPELEKRKRELQEAFNRYKIELLALEDNLLTRLANAPVDILSDVDLIISLEATKKASTEINAAVAKGKQTEIEINIARQVYVPAAVEGAMLYFMITQLNAINHMYQYSLDAYILYFYKAIREAPKSDDIKVRVETLKETMRLVIYTWVARGLFESDKIILMCQLTFTLMARNKIKDAEEFQGTVFSFLLRGPKKLGESLPAVLDWLPETAWNSIQALADLEGGEFSKLPADLIEAPARFKEWFTHVTPESEKLPLDWASLDKTPLKKLLVLRCMRPDRIMVALKDFVAMTLPNGKNYTECDGSSNSLAILDNTLLDASTTTPLYFILSPGADVVADVDKLAKRGGYEKGISYHNVSMGQGQDVIAMEKLEMAHKQGHWVILNNVHLMPRWLVDLEKKLDQFAAEVSHERFRIFLTSAPEPSIPIGMLSRSIKLTNEPPQGLKANLKRAFCTFSAEFINELDTKLRAIVFGLSMFHAVMIERKKFGPKGFNMMYPFATGDLRDSVVCLQNYMENTSGKIPWEDLRYIFGQIMYGGHIVNDFDRILCVAYLDHYLKDELLDEMELFPFNKDEKGATFKSPNPTTFDRYLEHIDVEYKGDTPIAFGLHPNAEIGFRTEQSEALLRLLLELQPRDGGGGGGDAQSPRAIAGAAMQDLLDAVGDVKWDLIDIQNSMEEVGPFQNVLILELQYLNRLAAVMRTSLATLRMGFDGKLTMSESMEKLETELSLDRVPSAWIKIAWPSLRALGAWKINLVGRIAQLNEWVGAPMDVPKCTWLGGLVNPQSFLTAVRQQTAQRNQQELDRLTIATDVTKRMGEEIDSASKDGAYITGLFMQGARFDLQAGIVDKCRPREMYCEMPVINIRSIPVDKLDLKGCYECPVYKTTQRGPTYVFNAQARNSTRARNNLPAATNTLTPHHTPRSARTAQDQVAKGALGHGGNLPRLRHCELSETLAYRQLGALLLQRGVPEKIWWVTMNSNYISTSAAPTAAYSSGAQPVRLADGRPQRVREARGRQRRVEPERAHRRAAWRRDVCAAGGAEGGGLGARKGVRRGGGGGGAVWVRTALYGQVSGRGTQSPTLCATPHSPRPRRPRRRSLRARSPT